MANRKGLIVSIYRCNAHGDCTNHAASSRMDTALLIGEGVPEIFEDRNDKPVYKLVTRDIMGKEYKHVEPISPVPSGHIGYMMGGNYVACSDSRFPNEYPLAIHDRYESQKQNEELST